MRASVVFSACLVAAFSAVYADSGAAPHGAPQAVHQQQEQQFSHQPQQQHQQQQQFDRQPHQLQQQQQLASGQQQQQAAPLPYPLRRQTSSGLDRARAAVMGMLESIMSAGARFRRMASARISTMLRRRSSPSSPLRQRAYQAQQPQPVAHHQPQQPHHQHPQEAPQHHQQQQQ